MSLRQGVYLENNTKRRKKKKRKGKKPIPIG